MQIKTLRSLSELDAIADQWRALEQRCTTSMVYFQTFDWCRNWIAHIAPGLSNTAPYVITLWRGNRLIALVPMMQSRVAGFVRVLSTLGDPHSQYAGMLSDPTDYDASAQAMLRDFLARPGDCDSLYVELLPETSPMVRLLGEASRDKGYHNLSSSLDLSQFASVSDYLEEWDPKKRRKQVQRRTKIEKQLGELKLRTVWAGEPEFDALVHRCVEMKKRWITETGRISTGFAIAGYAEFLCNLRADSARQEGAVAFVLQAGEQIIAVEVSMIRDKRLYAYIGGFDWDLKKLLPGRSRRRQRFAGVSRTG